MAITHWTLHRPIDEPNSSQKVIQWLQPASLDDEFPSQIGNQTWTLDFRRIEPLLWQLKTDSSGALLVNSETGDVLEQVVDPLPVNIKSVELERLEVLVERSMPLDSGATVADLIKRYYFYTLEHRQNLAALESAPASEKIKLLSLSEKRNKQRQVTFFGEDNARKLFAKKNKTTNYLNQRRRIGMDNKLTNEQKAEQLSSLQAEYQEALTN